MMGTIQLEVPMQTSYESCIVFLTSDHNYGESSQIAVIVRSMNTCRANPIIILLLVVTWVDDISSDPRKTPFT